jgi:hypothetical protein
MMGHRHVVVMHGHMHHHSKVVIHKDVH